MSDWANEQRELQIFRADMMRAEKGTLSERKEAARDFYEAMRSNPAHVAEQIAWIINGSYGQGAYIQARKVLASRMNKEAWLVQTVGALNWMCPTRMGVDAWKKLSAQEKSRLSSFVQMAIARATREDGRDRRRRVRRSAPARRTRVRLRRRSRR